MSFVEAFDQIKQLTAKMQTVATKAITDFMSNDQINPMDVVSSPALSSAPVNKSVQPAETKKILK